MPDMDPQLAKTIRTMPPGAVILWTVPPDTNVREPSALLKVPLVKAEWQASKIGYGRMELLRLIPEGPLIRFVFQVFPPNQHEPLTLDAFLNPADPDHRDMLMCMRKMIRFLVYGFDEGGQKLGTKQVTWHDQHRAGAMTLMVETEGIPVMWPQVVERWKRENPL